MPRGGEMTGKLPGDHRFSPADDDPFESMHAKPNTGRAFVKVHLERADNHEIMTFNLPLDGRLDPDDAKVIAYFFRCRRTGRQRSINPGVLALLADVAVQWPERTIEIISGFRAPPYGAPHSKHFRGLAIDLRIRGVRTTALRDYLWREHRGVGIGYYRKENFVHMDSRPAAHERAWSGSEEGGPTRPNPRWARKARRVPPTPRITPESLVQPYAFAPTPGSRTF